LSETYLSDVEKLFIVRLCDTMCSSENGSVEPFVGARARLCRQKDIVRRCEIALLRHDSPPDDPHAGSSVHSHDTEKLTQSAPTQRNRATPEKPDQPRSGPNCAVSGRAASSRRAAARTRTADHQSAPPQLRDNRTTVGALGRPVSLRSRQLAQEAVNAVEVNRRRARRGRRDSAPPAWLADRCSRSGTGEVPEGVELSV